MIFNKLLAQENLECYKFDINDEVLSGIVNHTLDYYAEKAIKSKIRFYWYNIIVLCSNASISVVAQLFQKNSVVVTIIAGIAMIFSSLLILTACKESWHDYRKHLELLKLEIFRYKSSIEEYENISPEERKILFFKRYESQINAESEHWEKRSNNISPVQHSKTM